MALKKAPVRYKLAGAVVACVGLAGAIAPNAFADSSSVQSFYEWNQAQEAQGLDYFTPAGLYEPATGVTIPVSALLASSSSTPSSGVAACIAQHESDGEAQVTNSSGHWGLYQFDETTWVASGGSPSDFGNASASVQTQVFNQAVSRFGYQPWTGDPCVG